MLVASVFAILKTSQIYAAFARIFPYLSTPWLWIGEQQKQSREMHLLWFIGIIYALSSAFALRMHILGFATVKSLKLPLRLANAIRFLFWIFVHMCSLSELICFSVPLTCDKWLKFCCGWRRTKSSIAVIQVVRRVVFVVRFVIRSCSHDDMVHSMYYTHRSTWAVRKHGAAVTLPFCNELGFS